MPSVYDKSQQSYRVDFACQTMLNFAKRGGSRSDLNPSRRFDTCFEMDDGDMVAAKVYRRALKNPRLMDVLPMFLSVNSVKKCYEELLAPQEK